MRNRFRGMVPFWGALLCSAFVCGCATTQDVSFMNQKVLQQTERLESAEQKISKAEIKLASLESETQSIKKALADLSVQVTHDKEELHATEASVEDYKQLIERSVSDHTKQMEEMRIKIERIEALVKRQSGDLEAIKMLRKEEASQPLYKREDLDEETFYNTVYETFNKGEFDKAMEGFAAFLEKYPKGRFADNALYWIGECYYRTDRFEQAILEYEKVKQGFPSGDKMPSALFKQALSFLKLNKKDEAKIILRELIEHYPQSEQAEMAKGQIERL